MAHPTFPTLSSMATRMATKDIKQITNLGDMEWHLAKPILEQVTNPQQLLDLQYRSPHLAKHTAELWKKMIYRDHPKASEYNYVPAREDQWWKVYRRLTKHDEREKKIAMAGLARDLAAITKEKVDNKVQFVKLALPSTDHEDATRRKITREHFPDTCSKPAAKPRSKFFQKIDKEKRELAIARGQIKDPKTRLRGMSSVKQVPITYNTKTWRNQDHYQSWGAGIGKKEEQIMVENYIRDHKDQIREQKEDEKEAEIASRYIKRRLSAKIAPGKGAQEKEKSPTPVASPPQREDARYVMPELGDELPVPFKPEEIAHGIKIDTQACSSKAGGPSIKSGIPTTAGRSAMSPKKRPAASIFIEPKRQRRA